MTDRMLEKFWDLLTPNLGMLALIGVIIGVIVGLTKKLVDKLGSTPVLIAIGAIVVVAWAVRYVTAPPKIVEVEKEVERVVEKIVDRPVEKIVEVPVKDTRESDALRRQLAAEQKEKQGLLQSLFGVKQELARRDDPVQQRNDAFAKLYNEAKAHPLYEITVEDNLHFILTMHEVRDDLLVRSVHHCTIEGDTASSWHLERFTIGLRTSLGVDIACWERRSPDRPLTPWLPIRRSAFPGVQSDR